MRKYVLICNNRRKKILYYYDFRDECVYCIDGGETSKNAEKGARKGGYYGGIIGIFLYPVLGKASYQKGISRHVKMTFLDISKWQIQICPKCLVMILIRIRPSHNA